MGNESAKAKVESKKLDIKEFELPDTTFIRDIEDRVLQSIVLHCLAHTTGISLIEGNFIDNLLGRKPTESVKGIYAEQDHKSHSVSIKVEVNIHYGISIPAKAEEIQTKIVEEITNLTGLHVASVHVVFKNVISEEEFKNGVVQSPFPANLEEEYSDEF